MYKGKKKYVRKPRIKCVFKSKKSMKTTNNMYENQKRMQTFIIHLCHQSNMSIFFLNNFGDVHCP